MYYSIVEEIVKLLRQLGKYFNIKKQLCIPAHPKRSRIVIMCVSGIAVGVIVFGGGLFGIVMLVNYVGSFQASVPLLLLSGIICLLVGILLKRDLSQDKMLKWWLGEIQWWK